MAKYNSTTLGALFLTFIAALGFSVPETLAHMRLVDPAPRSNEDGHKAPPPCGRDRKGQPSLQVEEGSQYEVIWEETIDHPSYYTISWATDDSGPFTTLPGAANIPDMQDGGNLPHTNSFIITIPSGVCANCTLQVVQWMTENPSNPRAYFSCADIEVIAAPGGDVGEDDDTGDGSNGEDDSGDGIPGEDGGSDGQASAGDVGKQEEGGAKTNKVPEMGGCGTINSGGPFPPIGTGLIGVFLPLAIALWVRLKKLKANSLETY